MIKTRYRHIPLCPGKPPTLLPQGKFYLLGLQRKAEVTSTKVGYPLQANKAALKAIQRRAAGWTQGALLSHVDDRGSVRFCESLSPASHTASHRRAITPHCHSYDSIRPFGLYFQLKPLPHIHPHGLPKVQSSKPRLQCHVTPGYYLVSFPVPCEVTGIGQWSNKYPALGGKPGPGTLSSLCVCSAYMFLELQ